MFGDVIECYQAMAETLAETAKSHWKRILVEATFQDVHVDVVVSYWDTDSEKPSGYLTTVPMLARYIYELARLVGSVEKGLFRMCRFELVSDGNFTVKFEY